MRTFDRTHYVLLVRTRGKPSVDYSREIDEPTDKAFVMDAIKEIDADKDEILAVFAFNPDEGWSRNVTEDFAREWLDELLRAGHDFTEEFPPFIERALGWQEAEELRADGDDRREPEPERDAYYSEEFA